MNNKTLRKAIGTWRQAKAEYVYTKELCFNKHGVSKTIKNKYLYFIGCGDAVKIGVSNDPETRLSALATGSPGPLVLLAKYPSAGNREAECHKKLNHLCIHGEWFKHTFEVDQLMAVIANEY